MALVLAGAGAAGWRVWQTVEQLRELHGTRERLSLRAAALADTLSLLRGPGTRVLQIPVSTNGQAGAVTIFADSVSHRWLVSCSGLAPNEPDQSYQLWWLTTAGPRNAAVLAITGSEPVLLTLNVPREATAVSMTVEPRAGAAPPSGPVVFRVTL